MDFYHVSINDCDLVLRSQSLEHWFYQLLHLGLTQAFAKIATYAIVLTFVTQVHGTAFTLFAESSLLNVLGQVAVEVAGTVDEKVGN